jgi:hypothetical protein
MRIAVSGLLGQSVRSSTIGNGGEGRSRVDFCKAKWTREACLRLEFFCMPRDEFPVPLY